MKSLLVALLLVAAACADEHVSAEWEALKAVSNSNLDFTNALYQKLSRQEGNLIFSPSSIHTILSLTSQGARGMTAQEMIAGLRLPADQQTTRLGFRTLTNAMTSQSDVTLKIANRVFTDKKLPPVAEFKQIASTDFHSSSQTVDFATHPDEARRAVNSWVEEQTAHKIKDLLEEGTVTGDTTVILANAVYFKGTWKAQFMTERTTNKPFYVSPELTKQVPMMHLTVQSQFGYRSSDVLNADILEIPYVGDKVSMVIILPKERFGLADVESKLAQLKFSNISTLVRSLSKPEVKLALPKFKLEWSKEMKDVLTELGMPHMFSDMADFSGLTPIPSKISKVAHKAFIEVNEEGAEAAAATGVIGVSRTHRILPDITFNADHPFIFMLVHTEKQRPHSERTILFIGRYVKP